MRRRTAFNLIVPLLLAFALAGCATTPEGKSFQGNKTLAFANQQFNAAVKAKVLTDQQTVAIGTALQAASAAMDRYDAAVLAHSDPATLDVLFASFDDALAKVEANLPALLADRLGKERKKLR